MGRLPFIMINFIESWREDLKVSEIHLRVKIPELQEWWTVLENFEKSFSEIKSSPKASNKKRPTKTGRREVLRSTEAIWNVIGAGLFPGRDVPLNWNCKVSEEKVKHRHFNKNKTTLWEMIHVLILYIKIWT